MLTLRAHAHWDQAAFIKMTEAMFTACRSLAESPSVDRSMAAFFWRCSWEPEALSNYEAVAAKGLHDEDLALVFDLASWFFDGEPPRLDWE